MIYEKPNQPGSKVSFRPRYDNYVNGEFVPPVKGMYFENPSPVTGKTFTEVARSTSEDIEKRSIPRTPRKTPGAKPRPATVRRS
jgi:aldehyde dehydrogenase